MYGFRKRLRDDDDRRNYTEFDDFINQYASYTIADYRENALPLQSIGFHLPARPAAQREPHLDIAAGAKHRPDAQPFDPSTLKDQRTFAFAQMIVRPGQSVFRDKVMKAYGGRCAVTGCDIPEALEAAHLVPYCGPESDHVRNGVLLRADLHALFDSHLLSFEPCGLRVRLATRAL